MFKFLQLGNICSDRVCVQGNWKLKVLRSVPLQKWEQILHVLVLNNTDWWYCSALEGGRVRRGFVEREKKGGGGFMDAYFSSR